MISAKPRMTKAGRLRQKLESLAESSHCGLFVKRYLTHMDFIAVILPQNEFRSAECFQLSAMMGSKTIFTVLACVGGSCWCSLWGKNWTNHKLGSCKFFSQGHKWELASAGTKTWEVLTHASVLGLLHFFFFFIL